MDKPPSGSAPSGPTIGVHRWPRTPGGRAGGGPRSPSPSRRTAPSGPSDHGSISPRTGAWRRPRAATWREACHRWIHVVPPRERSGSGRHRVRPVLLPPSTGRLAGAVRRDVRRGGARPVPRLRRRRPRRYRDRLQPLRHAGPRRPRGPGRERGAGAPAPGHGRHRRNRSSPMPVVSAEPRGRRPRPSPPRPSRTSAPFDVPIRLVLAPSGA